MSVLVTGATGLIGSYLMPLLNAAATGLYRSQPGEASARWIKCDLTAGPLAAPEGTESIVHLAQSRKFREFPQHANDVFGVNVQSTEWLLEAASRVGVKNFVLASTGGIYSPSSRPISEDSKVLEPPASYYTASKKAAESLCAGFKDQMNITILRFFFVYGREQNPSFLIPQLIAKVRAGTPISIQGRQGMRFNPTHAKDAAAAALAALQLEGFNLINVAGSSVTSIRSIADLIGSISGTSPVFEPTGEDAEDLVADTTLMRTKLGAPGTDLEWGLRDLI